MIPAHARRGACRAGGEGRPRRLCRAGAAASVPAARISSPAHKGDQALADDLAQETFLEAWKKLAQYRGEGMFAGWLLRIAWTRYLMEARRRKLEPLEETDERTAPQDMSLDLRLDLESSMRKLSAAERAGLTLCYAQGFSNEDAASILDMPLGTLKSHIARGRTKLKAMLGDGV